MIKYKCIRCVKIIFDSKVIMYIREESAYGEYMIQSRGLPKADISFGGMA